ncbi:MAG TPA: gamma-glutamyltransferase [Candidatus Polarisedimenticolaceae bacterium]
MKRALVLAAALATIPGSHASRGEGKMFATRSVVHARHGMVASSHPLATQIGLDVLKAGGTAVDAAIAVNAALGFLEPVACGIGGDLFALVWDAKTGTLHGLNASGRAPAAVRADAIPAEPDGTIPLFSPYAWTVPGAVDGWFALHAKFGRLPMKEVLAGPIRSAREGEPVPQVIAAAWARGGALHRDKPGFAAVFLPEGRAPRDGEVFRNPALAKAYELLAEQGRDGYYRGPIADALDAYSREVGGFLRKEDLAANRPTWVEPIATTYRGVTLYEIPPNGQGLAALEMLNLLEGFDLASMGRDSAEFWHVMIEAKKLAFEDRARFIADPEFAKVPIEGLLSKAYARERAKLLDRKRATARLEPGSPRFGSGDTTILVTADAAGNMVSLIQSNYAGFGSGYALAPYGFGLHNRGAQFDLKPGRANSLQPGKRPFHTIIPAFAMRDGKPWLAFGLMGGDMQPQGHVQVLVNLVDFGMNLQEAGDAPRFYHTDSSEPTGTLMTDGGVLALEPGVPAEVRRELARRGHRIQEQPAGAFGGYQAIARDPATGILSGASESRKDGCAAGY